MLDTGTVTDDPKELFDIVNENDIVIGQACREECNSNPELIHRAVFVIIFNDKNEILWQKRSMTKDIGPGLWTISACGHVDMGEDYAVAAVRETKEELGVDVEVEFLGKFLFKYNHENEYSAVFRAKSQGPFDPAPDEVDQVRFLPLEKALELDKQGEMNLGNSTKQVLSSINI